MWEEQLEITLCTDAEHLPNIWFDVMFTCSCSGIKGPAVPGGAAATGHHGSIFGLPLPPACPSLHAEMVDMHNQGEYV